MHGGRALYTCAVTIIGHSNKGNLQKGHYSDSTVPQN